MWSNKKLNSIVKWLANYSIEEIENSALSFFYEEKINWENPYSERKNSAIMTYLKGNMQDVSFEDIVHLFELLIPSSDKKLNWAFFTPDIIVNKIIQELDIKKSDSIIDPSCGCWSFLLWATKYLHDQLDLSFKEIFEKNIYGVDIAEYSVNRAKKVLTMMANCSWEFADFKFNIHVWNSLNISEIIWDKKFDVVLWNPPYVKYQDLPVGSRIELNNKRESISNGTFNLYFAFFELWYDILNNDWRLGYITPNNYFTSLAWESLRSFFKNKKCIQKIIDFKHRKIFDVLTYTAITILTKKENDLILYDHIWDDQQLNSYLGSISFSKVALKNLDNKKWRLLKLEDQTFIRIIESQPLKLWDVAKIKNWIATCKDEVYIIDWFIDGKFIKSYEWVQYEIEKWVLKKLYKISDLNPSEAVEKQGTWLIFPYKKLWNVFVLLWEDELKKEFPKTYAYLIKRKNDLSSRDKGKKEYERRYAYARSQGLNNEWEKLLSPTFSNKPRYMLNKENDSHFVNWYGIFINDKSWLFEPMLSLSVLRKILNSKIMEYYIEKTSVSIDGWYYCYQKNFTELFGIPQLSNADMQFLEKENNEDMIMEFLIKKYGLNSWTFSYT